MTGSGRLAGKVAIVTGAASGIGRATADRFLHEGARVVATDLATPDLAHPGDERVIWLAHDVQDEVGWADIMAATLARFGGLDILVNNAGIGGAGPLLDTTLAAWRRVQGVNLDGVFLGTRAGIAAMQAAGRPGSGSVINLSSVLGLVGGVGVSAYSASKGGVRLFTKSVALEACTMTRRVRVNSVHPGYIATPLLANRLTQLSQNGGRSVDALESDLVARHPVGRLGTAEDVANGILFLASDEADFVTGSELVIDGGYVAR